MKIFGFSGKHILFCGITLIGLKTVYDLWGAKKESDNLAKDICEKIKAKNNKMEQRLKIAEVTHRKLRQMETRLIILEWALRTFRSMNKIEISNVGECEKTVGEIYAKQKALINKVNEKLILDYLSIYETTSQTWKLPKRMKYCLPTFRARAKPTIGNVACCGIAFESMTNQQRNFVFEEVFICRNKSQKDSVLEKTNW